MDQASLIPQSFTASLGEEWIDVLRLQDSLGSSLWLVYASSMVRFWDCSEGDQIAWSKEGPLCRCQVLECG